MSKLSDTNPANIDEITKSDITMLPKIDPEIDHKIDDLEKLESFQNGSNLEFLEDDHINDQKNFDGFRTPSPEPENSYKDLSSMSRMQGLEESSFPLNVFGRLARPSKRASLSIEIDSDTKSDQEKELGIEERQTKISRSQSGLAKIALANFFIQQEIASEFKDQLILITQALTTQQSDPAGLIGPMLDKIFDGQEGKAKMAWIKKSQTYEHNGENITHRDEEISANIWTFEFANQFSEGNETLNVLTSKYEIIENFEVKDKEKSLKVDLGYEESVVLNSDNLVVWFKRFAYDLKKQTTVKLIADVKLESLKVKDNDESDVELVPSAILVHQGNSALTGHYVTYLLVKKDREIKWFCFDDSNVSEVLLNDVGSDGIPIKTSDNCYFVNYCNKSKIENTIPNVDEVMAFNNFHKNHCWFNASLVFLQAFKEFRDLAKNLTEKQSLEALTDSAFLSRSLPDSPSSRAKSPLAQTRSFKSRIV
ncbi:MAG: Ubiquitin carboxyl-terminal hydrolase [Pseudomonadota bacterium]|jgi:hypothetical protein